MGGRMNAWWPPALRGLSAWGSQTPTENACIVTHASGFVGTTGNQEHIQVAQNGSPCVMEMSAGAHGTRRSASDTSSPWLSSHHVRRGHLRSVPAFAPAKRPSCASYENPQVHHDVADLPRYCVGFPGYFQPEVFTWVDLNDESFLWVSLRGPLVLCPCRDTQIGRNVI